MVVDPVVPTVAIRAEGQGHQPPSQTDRAQHAQPHGDPAVQAHLAAADQTPIGRQPKRADGRYGDGENQRPQKPDQSPASKGRGHGSAQRWTHWPWAFLYHWPELMRGSSWVSNIRAPATSAVVPASEAL